MMRATVVPRLDSIVHEPRLDGSVLLTRDGETLRRRLLRCAQRIPYYRHLEATCESDMTPAELLSSFPIIEKDDLIELGPQLFEMPLSDAVLFAETGGTTAGAPLVTPRSAEELRWNSANLARAFDGALDRHSDRVAILHPTIMSPFSEACACALLSLGVGFLRVYPILGVCGYDRLMRILRDYGVTAVMTTPALIHKLLYERDRLPKREREWSVQRVLLTGELMTEPCLANVRRLAQADAAVFVYGSSEAATCFLGAPEGRYYPCLDDFAFELLPLSRLGQYELLVTWLNPGIRPLVRYRTRDGFRYEVQEGHDAALVSLEALGRTVPDEWTMDLARAVDETVYSMGGGVFHYDLTVSADSTGRLTLITDGQTPSDAENRLRVGLADLGIRHVNVSIDPEQHPFREFSPLPKLTRLRVPTEAARARA